MGDKDNQTGRQVLYYSEPEQEIIIQKKIAETSLRFLKQNYGRQRAQNEHLQNLFRKLQSDLKSLDGEFQETDNTNGEPLAEYQTIYLELLERQRKLLDDLNQSNEFDEELIRKYLSLIDFEEFEIRERGIN